MQYLIVTGNSEQNNACYSILQEVVRGAADGGAEVKVLPLEGIGNCKSCNDGSGECRTGRHCSFGKDGFNEAQKLVENSDALCIIAPIIWGELTDHIKSFLERLRRCENGIMGMLVGKPVLIVVSMDNTGNGLLASLEHMDRFCRQTGAVIFDYLNVNRWNNDYQKVSAYSAARSMAYGRKAGGTS